MSFKSNDDGPVIGRAAASGVSPRVQDLAPAGPWLEGVQILEVPNFEIREGSPIERSPLTNRPSAVEPDPDGAASVPIGAPSPATFLSFDGINNFQNAVANGGLLFTPPDTVGDVGPSHYVQATNTTVRIFDKTGFPVTGPFEMSQLFASISPSLCAARDDGDPIVTYDRFSDRWFISQFALPRAGNTTLGPFHQCIAVSQTGNPAGAYFVFDFEMPSNKFNDYPHFGMWPNAYFMTIHQFNAAGNRFAGSGVFAFDRARMLRGDPRASFVYFDREGADPGAFGFLPADADGTSLPPAGTPGVFVGFEANEFGAPADAVVMWEFNVDFANPSGATFAPLPDLPVAAFNPLSPSGRADIPQPTPSLATHRLDALSDRMMNRVQYRNFGPHESLVALHTVDVDATTAFRAAPRYYELRRTPAGAGPWVVFDEGTFAPADSENRWMGSVAMDRSGNIGFGYSVSSATVFPGVRYAGHLAGNPSGTFEDEAVMVDGAGVQLSTGSRWGDYSSMTVDPVDECTFWFTQEYYGAPNACASFSTAAQGVCWQTRIGAFRFPSCVSEPAQGTIQGAVVRGVATGIPNALVTASNGGFATVTDNFGSYALRVPAGTYQLTASRPGVASATTGMIIVPSGGTVTQNITLVGSPTLSLTPLVLTGAPVGSNNNGVVDIDECFTATATMSNAGFGNATNAQATLSSPTPLVTITTPTQSFGTVAAQGTAQSAAPFALRTEPGFVIGTPIRVDYAITSTEGAASGFSTIETGSSNPAGASFVATGPVTIGTTAGSTAVLSIPVSGVASAIDKVTVAMHVTHTFVNDLRIRLVGPDGTSVDLIDGRGRTGNRVNFGTDCPVTDGDDTRFDDAAALPIAQISSTNPAGPLAPFVGVFRPEQPLAAFNGKSDGAVNGNWTLMAEDFFNLDGGAIQCVALTINGHTTVSGSCSAPPTQPVATGSATPASVAVTGSTLLEVTVTPGINPTSSGVTVTANLSSIGGSATQAFVDPDLDNVWTFDATVPLATTPGLKSLPVTVTDAQARSATTNIALTVLTPVAISATASANPASVSVTESSLLSVTVSPGTQPVSSGTTVSADLSSIGGSATQAFADPDLDNVWTFNATVSLATTPGLKSLPVTVADAQSRNASANIALTVLTPGAIGATGAANPTSVSVTESSLLSVTVSPGTQPASSGTTVRADLSSIGGSATQAFVDPDLDNVWTFNATVPLATSPGVKSLPVTVGDAQARSASTNIGLTVVTPTQMTGSGAATPANVLPGGTTLLTFAVVSGSNPSSTGITATADLSSIGGSATQVLFDDGSSGDVTQNDRTFSFAATVGTGTVPGVKVLPVTVGDAQQRTLSGSIGLNVPMAGAPTAVAVASPSQVIVGNSTSLLVSVTPGTSPASSGLAVTANLASIGGSASQPFRDDGTLGDQTAGDNVFTFVATVPAGTAPGIKNLTATVSDAQLRQSTANVPLDVRSAGVLFGSGFENP